MAIIKNPISFSGRWQRLKEIGSRLKGMFGTSNAAQNLDEYHAQLNSDLSKAESFAKEDLPNYLYGLFSSTGGLYDEGQTFNSAEAEKNRQFQAEQAQIERDYYTNMSNSAYQRSVADLQKAGLNPALAYSQGGASSASVGAPSGSAASINAITGDTVTSTLSAVADIVGSIIGSSAKKNVTNYIKNFKD